MALSRIWSAFIIIALLVGSYHFMFNKGRDDIFGRMVTGTSKDEYKFVSVLDSSSTAAISKEMKDYSYILQKEADKETKYIPAASAILIKPINRAMMPIKPIQMLTAVVHVAITPSIGFCFLPVK